jgi:hypothetical protein
MAPLAVAWSKKLAAIGSIVAPSRGYLTAVMNISKP